MYRNISFLRYPLLKCFLIKIKKISLFPVSDTAVSGSKEKEIAFV